MMEREKEKEKLEVLKDWKAEVREPEDRERGGT